VRRTASQVLTEEVASVRDTDRFDIFLSHCLKDAPAVRGVKALLEEQGYSVYVDWEVDRQLDRERVTAATADVLRRRMRASNALYFATSENSSTSKWMPWELGYFDGLRQGRIAVFPLVAAAGGSFQGQEYLGLYPVVERLPSGGKVLPFVTKFPGSREYQGLGLFNKGEPAWKTY
jgi:hypothetical protein